MKKSLLVSALAFAVCGMLSAAEITHPMEYTLDLADGGLTEVKFADNSQYGTKGVSTRQDNTPPDWSALVKPNKPKAGDTVRVTGKLTFDMDIDNLYVNLVDNSPAANYWLRLSKGESAEGDTIIKDIKAGVPVDVDITFTLTADVKAKCIFNMAYGEQNGKLTTCKVERVGKSFVGDPEVLASLGRPKGQQTYKINLGDVSKLITFERGNDAFQAIFSFTSACGEWLPQKGDKVIITYKGTSNVDIDEPILLTLVENTAAVGWWKDLISTSEDKFQEFTEAGQVKAGKKFKTKLEFTLAESCKEGISVQMYYKNYEGASPAMLKFAK
ncbi:MAG: hypothetical protein K5681_00325 [Treponema sp.]|nr:hypothetical protein [Treponema sp.]